MTGVIICIKQQASQVIRLTFHGNGPEDVYSSGTSIGELTSLDLSYALALLSELVY